jgi:hypothetical protein
MLQPRLLPRRHYITIGSSATVVGSGDRTEW